jgi:hypothetical protein
MHYRSIIVLASLAFAGCSSSGDGGPPDKLSAAFLDTIHQACAKAFSCQSSYIPAMHNGRAFADYAGGATASACENSAKTLVLSFNGQDYLTKLDASVTASRIKYNATDYDTCAASLEGQTCDQAFQQNGAVFTAPAACSTFEIGQVPTAGTCTLDEDCAVATDSCDSTAHTCGGA